MTSETGYNPETVHSPPKSSQFTSLTSALMLSVKVLLDLPSGRFPKRFGALYAVTFPTRSG